MMKAQSLWNKARAGRVTALSCLENREPGSKARRSSTAMNGRRLQQQEDIADRLFAQFDITLNAA